MICFKVLRDNPRAKILWIDTIGTFSIQRANQIEGDPSVLERFIHVVSCTIESLYELLDLIDSTFREEEIKLIVIDPIVAPFRLLRTDTIKERVAAIGNFGLRLRKLCLKTTLLIINQMTTRLDKHDLERSFLIPSLGETWEIIPDLRLMLEGSYEEARSLFVYRSDFEEFDSKRRLFFEITVSPTSLLHQCSFDPLGTWYNLLQK